MRAAALLRAPAVSAPYSRFCALACCAASPAAADVDVDEAGVEADRIKNKCRVPVERHSIIMLFITGHERQDHYAG